jgi:beta-lactamase regulating signal transducer with metallopeptidase domain
MTAWMLHAIFVGGLVTAAACAFERTCGLIGMPRRWAWMGALVLTVLLPLATLLPETAGPLPEAVASAIDERPQVSVATESGAAWQAQLAMALRGAAARLERAEVSASSFLRLDRIDGRAVLILWMLLSLAVVTGLVGGAMQLRRVRRGWPRARIEGRNLRISTDVGPAVVGFLRPEIVLPRWSLELEKDDLRLILMHEREHLAARDTLLLAAGIGMLALAPWNPVVCYQLRRLRHATELDCDRRVLRGGAGRRGYGSVLLRVADRRTARLVPVLALIESPTRIERRLTAMMPSRIRFPRTRAAIAAVAAIAILAIACETEQGVATEPEARAVEDASPGLLRGMVLRNWVSIQRADGTVLAGYAATVRHSDGTLSPAVYRGPLKLGDLSSEGTFVFEAGRWSRIRELDAGDRVMQAQEPGFRENPAFRPLERAAAAMRRAAAALRTGENAGNDGEAKESES